MTSKRRHTEAKRYLDGHARHQKFVRQCIVCQKIGYDEHKLEERTEALFRQQIRKYYKPLSLDEAGRCADCAERLAE